MDNKNGCYGQAMPTNAVGIGESAHGNSTENAEREVFLRASSERAFDRRQKQRQCKLRPPYGGKTMFDAVDEGAEILGVRNAISKLCEAFPGEYWRKLDREMAYPSEFVKALTTAGFLSVLIPEDYGGAGLPISAAAAILEQIHRAGCNGAACHAQMYIMGTILRYGTPVQKEKWLPKIASGELRLQAFGVTEPTSGTDTASLKTTAKRDGDVYVVNGQKIWTSRAEYSDLMLLLARTTPKEQSTKRTKGLSVFLVDMNEAKRAGMTIRPIRTMMNHSTTEIFFDGVRVPAANLIGEEGDGFRYILSGMNAERILIAAECIGDAKWFLEKASKYAKERSVFGRPIGQNQGVQFPIAKAYAAMRAAELMVHDAARRYEAGADCGAEANMAKMLAADASWEAANTCVQTHGGFGFADEYDVERKFRETRLYQVAPISTNLVLSYIAEHVLGLPRSY
jgi:acyl-CoA dehydrogenase